MDFFRSIATESALYGWGITLILGIPLLVLVLGEVIERLDRQRSRFVPPLKNLRNLILPLLSLRLIVEHILGIEPTLITVRLIETLLWLGFMYNVLQLLGLMIGNTRLTDQEAANSDTVEAALTESQSIQIPRVWSELLRMLTIISVLFYVFGAVWGAPMDQVIAALGVGSIVIGFALQDTLSSLAAGLLIAFEKPFSIGHWIQYDAFEGQVIEMNWRTVRLRTRERDVIIVPNSLIGRDLSVNYTMLDPLHAELICMSFSYKNPPNQVKKILQETALTTPGVAAHPPPHVQVLDYNYDKFAIDYRIKLYTNSYEQIPFIRDRILTRIYYAAQRHRLELPYDTTIFYHRDGAMLDSTNDYPQRLAQLKSLPYFSHLDGPTLERLANGSMFQKYGRQEQLIAQGENFKGFYIILAGYITLAIQDSPKSEQSQSIDIYFENTYEESHHITTLGTGDFLGENLLHHDKPSLFNGIAVDDVQVLFIERQVILETIEINPKLANDMNRFLEERTKLVHRTTKNAQRAQNRAKQKPGYLPKQIPLVLMGLLYVLTACNALDLRPPTPTPDSNNPAIERFKNSAPAPLKANATEVSQHLLDRIIIPEGLPLPLVDPLTINGEIYVVGSPAMAPLMRALYQRFVAEGYQDIMKVEEVGNELGFQSYCRDGVADMVMATRPMIQSELELCMENGRMPFALRVGLDAVAIVVHDGSNSENDISFVKTMTIDEVTKLFTAERWSDVRRGWSNIEIIRYIPHTDSGIFEYFVDELFEGNELALRSAPETTLLYNEMEIALNIGDTPYAVGFVNYSTYAANTNKMKLLAIDRVLPTARNVVDGTYPLTRSLLLYITPQILKEKPQVNAFLMYYMTNMNHLIMDVGNFPVSEAVFERSKVVLLTAQEQLGYLEKFSPTETPKPTDVPTRFPISTPTAITTTVTSP